MIRISNNEIQNFPNGYDDKLDDLLCGEVNSIVMHYLKTPVNVYGRTVEEIIEYAKAVKECDSSYDTVDIYLEVENDVRDFYVTRNLIGDEE